MAPTAPVPPRSATTPALESIAVDEDRIIEIETKLAHQEHLVLELNRVISDQQQQISQLEHRYLALLDRVKSLADSAGNADPADERPPHY